MSITNRPMRVFLSHTTADRALARRVVEAVSEQNVDVFTADMISAAGNWKAELKGEIEDSDLFIVLLSPEALNSSFVLQELGAAWGLEKPLVVVLSRPDLRVPVDVSEHLVVPIERLSEPGVVHQILNLQRSTTAPDAAV